MRAYLGKRNNHSTTITVEVRSVEAFPLSILGAVTAIIATGMAIATVVFMKLRKKE